MGHHSSEALPSVAISTTRVVAFGYDRMLVGLRCRILRMSGYEVEETFTSAEAAEAVQSDLMDALIICHTVPSEERERLARMVRNRRKLMPILCIRAHQHDLIPSGCTSVDNSPVAILDAVQEAVRAYKSPSKDSIQLAS